MKFHICNVEPEGYPWAHFLDDGVRLFCYALESLGHSCSMSSNELEPDRLNIVFCGHLLTRPEQVDSIANGCRYIAIQHEVLHRQSVNLTGTPEHFRDVYLPFLQRATGVWEGISRNLPTLRQLGVRASFFRGGYHPQLHEVPRKREQEIDYLFFGSITPYRRQVLERLSQKGRRLTAVFNPRFHYRNDLIARAKVHLAPIQGPGMEHFAYGRVGYLLNNDKLVVVERCEDQEWLEHCFITSGSEHFVDTCEQTLQRSDREQIRQEFAERYRDLPFTSQVQRLLDETLTRSGGAPVVPATPAEITWQTS